MPTRWLGCVTGFLFLELQLLGHLHVYLRLVLLEIREQAAALADHLQKTATGVVVLRVLFELRGQLAHLAGDDENLNLGRAGVFLVALGLLYNARFDAFSKHYRHSKAFGENRQGGPGISQRDGLTALAAGLALTRSAPRYSLRDTRPTLHICRKIFLECV